MLLLIKFSFANWQQGHQYILSYACECVQQLNEPMMDKDEHRVSDMEFEDVVSCSTSDDFAGTEIGKLLRTHDTDVTDEDGSTLSTVFEVLPTTCRDSMKSLVETSVHSFHQVDPVECSMVSATGQGDIKSTVNAPVYDFHDDDDDDSVADPDFEPTDVSSADSTDAGSDSDDEISDLQTVSKTVTQDNSANNHVSKKSGNRDIPTLKCLSLFQKRERKPGCKQSYDKIHYCKFCGNAIRSKISRHLLNVHVDETAVKDILFLPKRSKERRTRLQRLINEGNFNHNITVIQKGEGEIVVGKRLPSKSAYDYTACEFCQRFESKKNLWRHIKSCSARAQYYKDTGEENRRRLLAVRRGNSLVANAAFASTGEHTKELFERMRADDIKTIVVSDELICRETDLRMAALGNKSEWKQDDIYRVSQATRTLGRIVQFARLTLPTATLTKLIEPQSFDLLVKIARKMSVDKESPSLNVG